jgi:hypothetical protein
VLERVKSKPAAGSLCCLAVVRIQLVLNHLLFFAGKPMNIDVGNSNINVNDVNVFLG